MAASKDPPDWERTEIGPRPANGGAAVSGWEPPVPFELGDAFEPGGRPAFPVHVLPGWLERWARAVSDMVQTPVDVAAVLGLAVVSLAVTKRFEVQVKPRWREPLNLYVVVVLPSGYGKSPVFKEAVEPVIAYEEAERARIAPKVTELRERRAIMEERRKVLRSVAAKGQNQAERDNARRESIQLSAAIAALQVPAMPRLIADDATPEALARLLHEQGERMGVFSSEGGPFEIMKGQYSQKGSNFVLFLKGHSGESCPVDRKGAEEPLLLRKPTLTLGLTVQRQVLTSFAESPDFRGKGLLARFLWVVPESNVGWREVDPPSMTPDVCNAYEMTVRTLLDLPGELDDESGAPVPRVLAFTEEAYAVFVAFKQRLEPRLRPFGDLREVVDWANKLPGAVARLAAQLHIAEHAEAGLANLPREVPARAVVNAIVLADYFVAHAVAAFSTMEEDVATADAKHVLAWLRSDGRRSLTKHDIHRGVRGRIKTAEALDKALRILVQRNYVRRLPNVQGVGRPSIPYEVSPFVGRDARRERDSMDAQDAAPTEGAQ